MNSPNAAVSDLSPAEIAKERIKFYTELFKVYAAFVAGLTATFVSMAGNVQRSNYIDSLQWFSFALGLIFCWLAYDCLSLVKGYLEADDDVEKELETEGVKETENAGEHGGA